MFLIVLHIFRGIIARVLVVPPACLISGDSCRTGTRGGVPRCSNLEINLVTDPESFNRREYFALFRLNYRIFRFSYFIFSLSSFLLYLNTNRIPVDLTTVLFYG